jgi:L-ascorbate metabolism protein UlaG (beta-lactamase superfamily)
VKLATGNQKADCFLISSSYHCFSIFYQQISMVITWYGQSCFKIQSGQTVLIIDPFDKKIGLTPPKLEAQMVLVTHEHYDHNNVGVIKGSPFIIDSPGEYEVGGVRVRGIFSYHDTVDNDKGDKREPNTIYTIRVEGIVLAHLGDLGQTQLTEEQLDALGEVDILMVPVGGTYTIGAKEAVEIIGQIEPKITIPMHYNVDGLKIKLAGVDRFLKELGQKDLKPQEKLTVKQNNLPDPEEKMEVVVLKN